MTSRPFHGAVGQTLTALLDAIARMFVAPGVDAGVEPVSVAAPRAAAVCGPGAEPLACALALMLRRRGPAVVCTWRADARRASAPATAGTRRLAASMMARGLAVQAVGRLVAVALDDEPSVAVAEAGRVAAAAGDAPVVIALCGPRDAAFDSLLAEQDVAVAAVQDAPDELVRLGIAALEETSLRAVAAPGLTAASARAAAMGLLVTPTARRALADAMQALR